MRNSTAAKQCMSGGCCATWSATPRSRKRWRLPFRAGQRAVLHPRLISAQTQRDLEWFFDDWVYRDHGLPDFKSRVRFSRKTLTDSFIVAVTVGQCGQRGRKFPVIVKFAKGEVMKRMEVRAKSKATIRLETPSSRWKSWSTMAAFPRATRRTIRSRLVHRQSRCRATSHSETAERRRNLLSSGRQQISRFVRNKRRGCG